MKEIGVETDVNTVLTGLTPEQKHAVSLLVQDYQDLKRENTELKNILQTAGEIQKRSLPNFGPKIEGYDTGALSISSKEVGGDFFDFFLPRTYKENPYESEVGFAIADAVDQNLPAEILISMTHSLFHAESFRYESPKDVLREVNYNLILSSKSDGLFVTALYGVLDPKTNLFKVAGGGHPTPRVYKENGDLIESPKTLGQPLNVSMSPRIEEAEIDIPNGGKILLYTDGIVEATNENGELFGEERLDDIVRKNWSLPAQEICQIAMDSACAHQGYPENFSDDCTVICIAKDNS